MHRLVIAVLALCIVAGPAAAQELKTDQDKALYAIGLSLSERLGPFALTPAEVELVKAGLADGVAGKPKLEARQYMQQIQQLRTSRAAKGQTLEPGESELPPMWTRSARAVSLALLKYPVINCGARTMISPVWPFGRKCVPDSVSTIATATSESGIPTDPSLLMPFSGFTMHAIIASVSE